VDLFVFRIKYRTQQNQVRLHFNHHQFFDKDGSSLVDICLLFEENCQPTLETAHPRRNKF
jgi:hypothetical protein